MSASPARIAANRRNARKSTGPRTAKGKAVASRNACKHGLLSRILPDRVIVNAQRFYKALCSEHAPKTRLEAYCVHAMALALAKMIMADEAECDLLNNNKPATVILELSRIVAYRDLFERDFIRAHKMLLRIKNKTNPIAPHEPPGTKNKTNPTEPEETPRPASKTMPISSTNRIRRARACRHARPASLLTLPRVKIELLMPAEIEQITRLQNLDGKIAAMEREVAALPKHIAKIEKALDIHLRRVEADRAALTANQRERKSAEEDIKTQQQKISKLRDQMLGAKNNDQYRAFQHEIEFCEAEIKRSEDRILELMGEAEPLDANAKKAETALKEEKLQVEAEQSKARECTARDRKWLDEMKAERKTIVSGIKPQVYSIYERIRKKWHGIAIAEAIGERCSACQISLRPQFFQDLKKGDQLMFCESCGRILYYNPPVRFDHDIAATAAPTV